MGNGKKHLIKRPGEFKGKMDLRNRARKGSIWGAAHTHYEEGGKEDVENDNRPLVF